MILIGLFVGLFLLVVMASARKQIDWEKIEIDYRAGIKTLREIADDNGISHGAVNKRAKRDGWTRDLSKKIRDKANDLVSKHEVSKKVSKEKLVTERITVDVIAEVAAEVKIRQRDDLEKFRCLERELLAELTMAKVDDLALAMRVDLAKKLADVKKTLYALEDSIFGFGDRNGGSDDNEYGYVIVPAKIANG